MTPEYASDVAEALLDHSCTLGRMRNALTQIALRLDQDQAKDVAELLTTIRDARSHVFRGFALARQIAGRVEIASPPPKPKKTRAPRAKKTKETTT